ncbi:OmpW family protein [Lysobacter sp. N42]|uniref:OmpW/AlkL family protein n=1 Tax=Lysobacter sp. N42 TaxID=2545719 RepID=UPI001051BA8F|nr:OmpW family outer membrane protein [Lysobacter sp. N42]TCZ87913.1 OmpW family protein [Lysobacter sp. N42]
MKLQLGRSVLALALAAASLPALAQSRGDYTLGIGAHQVNPKSGNGALAGGSLPLDIGSSVRPTFTGEYFIADNLGIELLAALPFHHDIDVEGVGKVGSTKHLPPTVSLQYHFNAGGKVSPLLGVGLNYTTFFKERTTGALAGTSLELDDSWGAAVHAGVDFKLGERGAIRVDARWMDIDTDVSVNGTMLGTAEIDPLAYGVAYVRAF